MNYGFLLQQIEVAHLDLQYEPVQPAHVVELMSFVNKARPIIEQKLTEEEICFVAEAMNGVRYMFELPPQQIVSNVRTHLYALSTFEKVEVDAEFRAGLLDKLNNLSNGELLTLLYMAHSAYY